MNSKPVSISTKMDVGSLLKKEKTFSLTDSLSAVESYTDSALKKLSNVLGEDVTDDSLLKKAEEKTMGYMKDVQKAAGASFDSIKESAESFVEDKLGEVEDLAPDIGLKDVTSKAKELTSLYSKARSYCSNVGETPDYLSKLAGLSGIVDSLKNALSLGDTDLAGLLLNCMKALGNDAIGALGEMVPKIGIQCALGGSPDLYGTFLDTVGMENVSDITGDLTSIAKNAGADLNIPSMTDLCNKTIGDPKKLFNVESVGGLESFGVDKLKDFSSASKGAKNFLDATVGENTSDIVKAIF